MTFALVCLALIVIARIAYAINERAPSAWNSHGAYYHRDWVEITSAIGGTLAGLILVLGLIFIPVIRSDARQDILEIETTRDSIEYARSQGVSIEHAALQVIIIETNNKIARLRSGNRRMDWWYPDNVDSLEFLR